MPDKPVATVVSGGGGAPQIPPRRLGKPGVREVADMCSGKEYAYLKGMRDQATIAQGHNPKPSKSKRLVQNAMSEVHQNIPSTVETTGKRGAAREKMLAAVAFSKARAKGAKV